MTTLDLRKLADSERLARLNEAVAIHVARIEQSYTVSKGGYYYRPPAIGYTAEIDEAARYTKAVATEHCRGCRELRMEPLPYPPFATSADVVLPLLEKSGKDIIVVWSGGSWSVQIQEDRNVGTEDYDVATIGEYDGPSLAECACIALLRANGCEVLT